MTQKDGRAVRYAKGWKGSAFSGCSRQGGGLGAYFLITQGTADTVPRGHEMFRDPKTVKLLVFLKSEEKVNVTITNMEHQSSLGYIRLYKPVHSLVIVNIFYGEGAHKGKRASDPQKSSLSPGWAANNNLSRFSTCKFFLVFPFLFNH